MACPRTSLFHDRTLAEIAERQCRDWADLAAISGVGPAKLEDATRTRSWRSSRHGWKGVVLAGVTWRFVSEHQADHGV